MKDMNLIVWLTQLGLSVAAPLAGFILLAVWLRDSWGWGDWVIWVGVILGILSAVSGLRSLLQILSRISGDKKDDDSSVVSFNDHD